MGLRLPLVRVYQHELIKETKKYPAIIMEFKVRNIKREEIHHYGFAFEGKKVLIG